MGEVADDEILSAVRFYVASARGFYFFKVIYTISQGDCERRPLASCLSVRSSVRQLGKALFILRVLSENLYRKILLIFPFV